MKNLIAFILAAVVSTISMADLVTEPVVAQANQEFVATIEPATGTVSSYGYIWKRNGTIQFNGTLPASTVELTRTIAVKNGDTVCVEVWAKNLAGETAHDQKCTVVDWLPTIPGQPVVVSLTVAQ